MIDLTSSSRWSMLISILAVTVGCASLLFLMSCDKDGPTDPRMTVYVLDTTLQLYPMTVGDQCSFAEESLSVSGEVKAYQMWGPFQVTNSSTVGGITRFFDRTWNAWVWEGPGGVWIQWNAPIDTTRALYWKWPCKKGDTWTTRYPPIGLDVQVTVEAVDRVITTPARRDTCIVYTYRHNDSLVSVIYLAPGFGWLYEVDYFTRSSMRTYGSNLLPLVSYPRFRYAVTSVVRAGTVP